LIGDKEALGIFGGEGVSYLNEAISINELSVRKVRGDLLIEGYIV
jgi:hypothetical protein